MCGPSPTRRPLRVFTQDRRALRQLPRRSPPVCSLRQPRYDFRAIPPSETSPVALALRECHFGTPIASHAIFSPRAARHRAKCQNRFSPYTAAALSPLGRIRFPPHSCDPLAVSSFSRSPPQAPSPAPSASPLRSARGALPSPSPSPSLPPAPLTASPSTPAASSTRTSPSPVPAPASAPSSPARPALPTSPSHPDIPASASGPWSPQTPQTPSSAPDQSPPSAPDRSASSSPAWSRPLLEIPATFTAATAHPRPVLPSSSRPASSWMRVATSSSPIPETTVFVASMLPAASSPPTPATATAVPSATVGPRPRPASPAQLPSLWTAPATSTSPTPETTLSESSAVRPASSPPLLEHWAPRAAAATVVSPPHATFDNPNGIAPRQSWQALRRRYRQ